MLTTNAIIIAVAGSQNYAVRYLFNPKKKKLQHCIYDDETDFAVSGYGEETAEQVIAHTLEQYAEAGYKGHLAVVTMKNTAIRLRSVRKYLKDNEADDVADCINDSLSFDLSESHMETLTELANIYEDYLDSATSMSVSDYDAFNLHHWRVSVLKDDVELKDEEDSFLKVKFTRNKEDNQLYALDGALRLETNSEAYENVELQLEEVADGRNTALAVVRIGDQIRLRNLQKLWDRTMNLFDAEDDLDTMEDIDENAENEEEEEDLDDLEDIG